MRIRMRKRKRKRKRTGMMQRIGCVAHGGVGAGGGMAFLGGGQKEKKRGRTEGSKEGSKEVRKEVRK